MFRAALIFIFACLTTLAPRALFAEFDSSHRQSRTFDFTYSAEIKLPRTDAAARMWFPLPPENDQQHIEILSQHLPGNLTTKTTEANDNRMLYLQVPPGGDGKIDLSIAYRVTRYETGEIPATRSANDDQKYLEPNALVPVGGKPASLLSGLSLSQDQLQLGHQLYDLVDDRMQYRKDKPGWGRGDAVWACDSRFGNCTDFHSLFISLARTEKMPAKFVIGFAIPEPRGSGPIAGYHCWAMFRPRDHGWIPVDIAEASLNPPERDYYFGHLDDNRVMFTSGRDLTLNPKQDASPLNFFVYPYVEQAGQPLPAQQIHMNCSYRDVDPASQPSLHHGR
jgi:hypothetical protein